MSAEWLVDVQLNSVLNTRNNSVQHQTAMTHLNYSMQVFANVLGQTTIVNCECQDMIKCCSAE